MAKKKGIRPNLRIFDRLTQPPPPNPRQDGLQLFMANDFNGAIAAWLALAGSDGAVRAALAEAYFRRALLQRADTPRQADLRQAALLAPADPRFAYHLGLALHRAGDLPGAIERYRATLRLDPSWPGAGLLLALASLQQAPRADLAALPGYGEDLRATLAPVQALLGGEEPGDGDDPVGRLWHGLALIRRGDGRAQGVLEDGRPLPGARATAVRRYYRGVASAQRGEIDAALRAWQHVSGERDAHPWLWDNLVAALLADGGSRVDPADLTGNGQAAQRLRDLAKGNAALAAMLVKSLDDVAREAATQGDWTRALGLWEQGRELVASTSGLGSPRSLLHNLSIANERLERWPEAAEAWRAMLRTRPRTAKGEGDYTDEQWAWVRKRVVECYKNAGTPGEAVALFRQALKKEPQDLDTRLQLADALLANDQEQAAFNELHRILEIDAHHPEAILRLAALHAQRYEWHRALALARVLYADHSEREDARTLMLAMLQQQGLAFQDNDHYARAIALFDEGRQLAPDDWHFPLFIARTYIDQRQVAKAGQQLKAAEALAGDRPSAYQLIIDAWAVIGNIPEARAALDQAEASRAATSDFYMETATTLLSHRARVPLWLVAPRKGNSKEDQILADFAAEVVARGAAREPGNAKTQQRAATVLLLESPEVAVRYAEEAVRLAPESADILSTLGTLQGLNGDSKAARQSLRTAAKIARQQGNAPLADQYDELSRLSANAALLRERLEMVTAMASMRGFLGDMGLDDEDLEF